MTLLFEVVKPPPLDFGSLHEAYFLAGARFAAGLATGFLAAGLATGFLAAVFAGVFFAAARATGALATGVLSSASRSW